MRKIALTLIIMLALAAGFSSSPLIAAGDALVPQAERTTPPKMYFSDIPGARKALTQFKGKIVVVNFWATWCAPCKAEMPEFVKAYEEYRARGVEFIGAANEARSEKKKVSEFILGMRMQFPVWLEASEAHMKALGVGPGLPGTVILDTQGRIAVKINGVTEGAQLRELLDRLLREQAPSAPAGGR